MATPNAPHTGYTDLTGDAVNSVIAEHEASEARVLAEAGMICALCLLPIVSGEKTLILKPSEHAPSQIVHDECEEHATLMAHAASMFARFGAKGLRGQQGFAALRIPRE